MCFFRKKKTGGKTAMNKEKYKLQYLLTQNENVIGKWRNEYN